MSQPIEEIEKHYEQPDPWGYKTSPEDAKRKMYLIGLAKLFCDIYLGGHAKNAIDICCGEGFISESLPAEIIHGLEISDKAAARFPANMKRVLEPEGKYNLVMATGCLYAHYDWKNIVRQIGAASDENTIIIISNIESWEHDPALNAIYNLGAKQLFHATFPYNEHHQKVRVFEL